MTELKAAMHHIKGALPPSSRAEVEEGWTDPLLDEQSGLLQEWKGSFGLVEVEWEEDVSMGEAVAFEEVKVTQKMESGQWPCGDLPEFSGEFPEYRFQKICPKNVQVPMLTALSAVGGVTDRGRGDCTHT